MKTEKLKVLENIEVGFEIIDLDTFVEDIYGGDNTCTIHNSGNCFVESSK